MNTTSVTLTAERHAELEAYANRRGEDVETALDEVLAEYFSWEKQDEEQTVTALLDTQNRTSASRKHADPQAATSIFRASNAWSTNCLLSHMLRYALRMYAKSPLTTAVMILALALGIGVNASTFISLEAIILHPLPYPALERIVSIQETSHAHPEDRLPLTPADYLAIQQDAPEFAQVAAYSEQGITYSAAEQSERIRGAQVSSRFFAVLGMNPIAGRTLPSGSETGTHPHIAVVSEAFANTRLGGVEHSVDRTIHLNGLPYEVIGVMPDQFDWPLSSSVWIPLELNQKAEQDRTSHTLGVLGLLHPHTALPQATAQLQTKANHLAREYPDAEKGREYTVSELRNLNGDEVTNHFILVLMGASSFVLLLACANVGNLQLARAATRDREMAVRAALGASRWQVVRPFVVECVLLSLVSGVIGLALASWRNDIMKALIPAQAFRWVPGLRTMHVDARVALFCIAISLAAGLVSALPALFDLLRRKSSATANEALRTRNPSAARSRHRVRGMLVVMELALSLVLLVGAGLMVATFARIAHRELGYQTKNVLQMRVEITSAATRTPIDMQRYYDNALEQLRLVPGSSSVSLVNDRGVGALEIEGRAALTPADPQPEHSVISASYFDTLRIPLLQGRSVSASDTRDRPPIAVISNSLARYYWPKGDALGHRIRLAPDAPWATITGIAGDVVHDWFSGTASKDVYLPYTQVADNSATFLIRTDRDPEQLAHSARGALAAVDATVPPYDVETLQKAQAEERTGVSMAEESMLLYAGIALVLSVTGIYGVVSYFVAARTHDIGVRIALGAQRVNVLSLVMREAFTLTGLGLAIGLPSAFLLARTMAHVLYNVVPNSPGTVFELGAVLALSALFASYLPTRRALKIDPIIALRDE